MDGLGKVPQAVLHHMHWTSTPLYWATWGDAVAWYWWVPQDRVSPSSAGTCSEKRTCRMNQEHGCMHKCFHKHISR